MDEEHNRSHYLPTWEPHAQLYLGLRILRHLFGVTDVHHLCTEASFHPSSPIGLGAVNTKTLAASMPVFDSAYQMSVVAKKTALERHWTVNTLL